MSADLLAEFGSSSASSPAPNTSSQSQRQFQTGSLIPDIELFEDVTANPNSRDSRAAGYPDSLRESTDQVTSERISNPSLTRSIWRQDHRGTDVLFDAATEDAPCDDNDDDWGEFESAEMFPEKKQSISDFEVGILSASVRDQSAAQGASGSSSDVLDLMDQLSIEDNISSVGRQRPSPTTKRGGPISSGRIHHFDKTPNIPQSVPAQTQQDSFDEWGDFVDACPEEPVSPEGLANTGAGERLANNRHNVNLGNILHAAGETPRDTVTVQKESQVSESQVRPTNIPPPSVLLQLFPPLFERLQEEAAKAKEDAEGSTISLYLVLNLTCTLKVAARIIAGRTLRWKRDMLLSQSTKIGPARSGKHGGMKLSTVSKSETVKEEQEALEVLDAWRRRAALFNSLMLSSGERPISVLAVHSKVEIAKGALKAPHACALCGLKRDERLQKFDENVQDSFGDWWVEHWGHTDCKQFWEENSKFLHQR